MQNQELDPSVEVAHLRRLLDIQPACLMRLGADGTLLAANDAALALLGLTSVAQALLMNFSDWVPPDQRERWKAFAAGVVQGGSASLECDINAQSGDRHPTLFHAVPLADHPDGVASMAVAARAVATQRQLETAVVDLEARLRERDVALMKVRAQLAETEARSATLAEAEAARRAAEAQAAQARADAQQLQMALDAFSARQRASMAERAAAREREAGQSALAAAHEALTVEHARLLDALRSEAGRLQALVGGFPQARDGREEGIV